MIIFISGPIHAGKSTVAKLLAERLGSAAVVEIDALREFISWMPLKESIPLNLENAAAVIENFARAGLHTVVPYPLSRENHAYLAGRLASYTDTLHFFTLAPRKEVALEKRGVRELSDSERERITQQYAVGIANPDFGTVLDNSDESPKATVERILQILPPQ